MNAGNMKIFPLVYGRSTFSEKWIFENGDESKMRPIVFMVFLIKTADRLILIDAGCETMPGFIMKDFIGTVTAIKNIGLVPEDITDIIITHSHYDHIECVKYFKNADIYIQKDEYENGKNYLTPELRVHTFENEMQICDGVKAVKIGGHSIGSSIVEIDGGGEKYVIAGDEFYARECIDKKITPGAPYCRENSRKFLEKYTGGDYKILLCHDK